MGHDYSFARNGNARSLEPKPPVPRPRAVTRPLILIGGPERLSVKEALTLGDALKERHASVEVFRITDEFRMSEFRESLGGCAWLLLAVDEFPGYELEMLREAQNAGIPIPKIGIICLADRVQTSGTRHIGGTVEFIVRRTPGDMSLGSLTRTHHFLLVEDLTNEASARSIARIVVPQEL